MQHGPWLAACLGLADAETLEKSVQAANDAGVLGILVGIVHLVRVRTQIVKLVVSRAPNRIIERVLSGKDTNRLERIPVGPDVGFFVKIVGPEFDGEGLAVFASAHEDVDGFAVKVRGQGRSGEGEQSWGKVSVGVERVRDGVFGDSRSADDQGLFEGGMVRKQDENHPMTITRLTTRISSSIPVILPAPIRWCPKWNPLSEVNTK